MQISSWQRLWYGLTGWRGFVYPDQPVLPARPWHPDGDELFTRMPDRRLANSDAIIAHMKRFGRLRVGSGSTRPATWDGSGTVNGYVLNRAQAGDPEFVIERPKEWSLPRAGTIYGSVYGSDPLGAVVRYHDRMIRQGEPAGSYSDNKVHIFDDVDGVATITEIQNFRGVIGGVVQCDGVSQYRLDASSWDVRGRSAAKIPLAESVLRFDDVRAGVLRRCTMGTKMASSQRVLWPAEGTDTQRIYGERVTAHRDADAVPMGAILRLKEGAVERVRRASGLPAERRHMLDTVLACFAGPGIMVVDTADGHAVSLEPDNRWNQREVGVLAQLTLDDFEVWCLDPA